MRLTDTSLDALTAARRRDIRISLAQGVHLTPEDAAWLADDVGYRAFLAPASIAGDEWDVYMRQRFPGRADGGAVATYDEEGRLSMLSQAVEAFCRENGTTRDAYCRQVVQPQRRAWQRRTVASYQPVEYPPPPPRRRARSPATNIATA